MLSTQVDERSASGKPGGGCLESPLFYGYALPRGYRGSWWVRPPWSCGVGGCCKAVMPVQHCLGLQCICTVANWCGGAQGAWLGSTSGPALQTCCQEPGVGLELYRYCVDLEKVADHICRDVTGEGTRRDTLLRLAWECLGIPLTLTLTLWRSWPSRVLLTPIIYFRDVIRVHVALN